MGSILVPHEQTILFSSDPNLGAENLNSDQNTFTTSFTSSPIVIPSTAQGAKVEVASASIWNTVPNIVTGDNDQVEIVANSTTYLITIPQGNYGVSDINSYLNAYLKSQDSSLDNIFTMAADVPSDKVIITSNDTAFEEFNVTTNARTTAFGTLIGWTSDQSFTAVGEFYYGSTIAQINNVDYFLLHCDLINDGILLNGQYYQIIGRVPITVGPGFLIEYEPSTPQKIGASLLQGTVGRTTIRSWVTNQNNELVVMPDYFSFTLRISYLLPSIIG